MLPHEVGMQVGGDEALRELVSEFKAETRKRTGKDFPDDAF